MFETFSDTKGARIIKVSRLPSYFLRSNQPHLAYTFVVSCRAFVFWLYPYIIIWVSTIIVLAPCKLWTTCV